MTDTTLDLRPLTHEELMNIVRSLPPTLRDYLYADETGERSVGIRARHIHDRRSSAMALKVTARTMMGLLPMRDFVRNLSAAAALPSDIATALAHDLNREIFQPVKNELIEVHGIKTNQELRGTNYENGTNKMPIATSQSAPPVPEQSPSAPTTPVHPPAVSSPVSPEEQRRAELLERLKTHHPHPPASLPIAPSEPNVAQDRPDTKKGGTKNGSGDRFTATTAAWNGKKIDLTRIPPRRERPTNGNSASAEVEYNGMRYIKLERGEDGYWYES